MASVSRDSWFMTKSLNELEQEIDKLTSRLQLVGELCVLLINIGLLPSIMLCLYLFIQ